MIVNQQLVKRIKDYFGLNIYETKVWLALLGKGMATAGEIAELSGVPRSRTYDVLESLEKQGFAIAKIGKPVKYLAVKPTVILEKLKRNALSDAKEKVEVLSSLKETKEYNELETLHKQGIEPIKHSDLSGAIRGKNNIYSHIREILENAGKEVIIVFSAKEIENKSRIFSPLFDRLNKNKINIKLALNGTDDDIKKINSKYKVKAKKLDVSGRFFIADRKEILFMVSPENVHDDYDIGIWLSTDFLAGALAYLFDMAWQAKK